MARSTSLALALVVLLVTLTSFESPQARGGFAPPLPADDPVAVQLDALAVDLADMKRPKLRFRLGFLAAFSSFGYRHGYVCFAVWVMDLHQRVLERARSHDPDGALERVYNRGWNLRLALLAGAVGRSCEDPRVGREPEVDIVESDNEGFAASIAFGELELGSVEAAGRIWTTVEVPGTRAQVGPFGTPSLPVYHALVALPRGAEARLTASVERLPAMSMNLHPVQEGAAMLPSPDVYQEEPPPENAFDDPPFQIDEDVYAREGAFPAEPCSLRIVASFRDLQVAEVACHTAQYDPAAGELTPLAGVEIAVEFLGGDGVFLSEAAFGPFESASATPELAVLNREAVGRYVGPDLVARICLGEEFIILTHADLLDEAVRLRDWKRARGIATNVFVVNDGPGGGPDDPYEIRDFVADRYRTCSVRVSYLLLFGDAEYVPTFYETNPIYPDRVIPSDFRYGQVAGPAILGSDLGVGRLPVDPPDAPGVVDKIIAYESAPPVLDDDNLFFYEAVTVASQFECCRYELPDGKDQRAFIRTVEDVRTRLMSLGFGVERIYTETVDGGDEDADPPRPPYAGDPTPLYYADGTPLPNSLLPPYPWDGDTADIVAAFEEGRFMMIHLDHGWSYGWAHPRLDGDDASALSNGDRLPVLLSFNCTSGYYDNETDGLPNDPDVDGDAGYVPFTERMLRNPDGGAIGLIAATRTTYGHGNIMIRGAVDSALPAVDPNFGSPFAQRRLGDMLNHARLYMIVNYGAGSNTHRHVLLYQVFGDPTLEMWTAEPRVLPEIPLEVELYPDFIEVLYPVNDAVITALQETPDGLRPIGRGRVDDGVALLELAEQPISGVPIQYSANMENHIPAQLSDPSVP